MRGVDDRQDSMFSYVSLDSRVPKDHPLRRVRDMVDQALTRMSKEFEAIYASEGRPSIAPERLLRALLIQVLYSIRSERLLCEQLDYNLLFRWFVGLSADEPVWNHSTFSKNRDRLLEADIARVFFAEIYRQAQDAGLTSDEHFSVDGTLIDARTTRHPGYAISQRIRKRIEEGFVWAKSIGSLGKTKFRGTARVDFQFVLTMAAYNLIRLRGLLEPAPT